MVCGICVCVLLRFVLAACDGLWKVFTAQEALSFVTAILKVGSCGIACPLKCLLCFLCCPLVCTPLLHSHHITSYPVMHSCKYTHFFSCFFLLPGRLIYLNGHVPGLCRMTPLCHLLVSCLVCCVHSCKLSTRQACFDSFTQASE